MYFVKILVRIILEYHTFNFFEIIRFEGRLNLEKIQKFWFSSLNCHFWGRESKNDNQGAFLDF